MGRSAIACRDDVPSGGEASLVAAAREGDVSVFCILATNYRRKILNRVRHITGNFYDSEEVTQQAFIKAFVNIRGFRGMSSFSTWLTRLAINEALMLKRKPRARLEVGWSSSLSNENGVVPEIADIRLNPEQSYDKQQRRELMKAALKALNPDSRQALETCDLNEYSLQDLALTQDSSVCAAKSPLFRSRNLLRAKVNHSLRAKAVGRARLSLQLA